MFTSLRVRWGLGLAAALVAVALIPVVLAQTRRPAASPLEAATRAYIEGRYDEVASLTSTLNAQDPTVAALRARADVARGRYQQAEAALRPIAQRAPTSDAALELGLLAQTLGRPDAEAILQRVANAPAQGAQALARLGRALRALGQFHPADDQFHPANDAYRAAAAAAPHDPAINTAWGDLFLEKANRKEALTSYRDALADDPKWEPAILGSARVIIDEDPPQAQKLAEQALAINPSDVDAYVFIAGAQAVDPVHRSDARKTLQKALDVNPSSPAARSLLAALDYVQDNRTDFQAEADRVLAVAPHYGEFYRVAASLTAQSYRFEEAAVLARKGLEIDPKNADILTDLGLDLLRTGDEAGARKALDASWEFDPFNLVTKNLLDMMDKLDKFVTVQEGDVILRVSKEEAPILQAPAMALAHQAIAALAKRYEFTPTGPFLVEIFPTHADFAVRTAGLPGMFGALGACFGRVVTMESPRAENTFNFQWQATLWHELAHVFTLQMSEQRIPRWLTEGISVYEQRIARPEWARAQDFDFAGAIATDQVIKLKDLNDAFQNPKLISIAYFQGSILVDYLVEHFGDAGLHKLVRAYAKGGDTDQVLKSELNTSFAEMQSSFDEYLDRRFGAAARALAPPKDDAKLMEMDLPALEAYVAGHEGSFVPQMLLGSRLEDAGRADEALQAFGRAASLVPVAIGPESPHDKMAQIAVARKDRRRAIAELHSLIAVDLDNLKAARQLATLMKDEGLTSAADLRPVYERIAALDPFDGEPHTMLGRFALAQNDTATATQEFTIALASKPVDQASAHTDLATALLRSGKRPEAREETLAALEIAPSYERAQDLLLQLSENRH